MISFSLADRPHTTVVLAMSADGKIADVHRSPARFGSSLDRSHLETQLAEADGVLFGAGTLRAYRTTLKITSPPLLQKRQQNGKPPQPIHLVFSRSANLDPGFPFFQQPVPRWLITTAAGANSWGSNSGFERILTFTDAKLNWGDMLRQLKSLGIDRLAVTGGGELVAGLLAVDLIDELWLTVCPLILGGATAPTPVSGSGFSESLAPRLRLIAAEAIDDEVFLHYRRQRSTESLPL